MPPKVKKQKENVKGKQLSESESSDSDNDSDISTEKIDVDFEAYDMIDSDLNGIRNLLHQLFLKANLNITELAELIINQKNIGCIFKPTCVADENEEKTEEPMDIDDDDLDIFGVVSVLDLSNSSVKDLRSSLQSQLKSCADADIRSQMAEVAGPNSHFSLGFILNERLINIPCHIAVPSFESLLKDIKTAKLNFDYFIFLLKLNKRDSSQSGVKSGKRKNKSAQVESDPVIFANPEEEYLMEFTQLWFDYEVSDETDSGLTGNWTSDDSAYKPYRRLLILPANQMENFLGRLKADLAQQTV